MVDVLNSVPDRDNQVLAINLECGRVNCKEEEEEEAISIKSSGNKAFAMLKAHCECELCS